MSIARGVVYVTAGDRQFDLAALRSLISLRHWYDGPVIVYTTRRSDVLTAMRKKLGAQVIKPHGVNLDDKMPSRSIKTRLGLLSPFRTTLFLDADTLVLKNISTIWSYAEKGHIAMARDWSDPTVGDLAKDESIRLRDDSVLIADVQRTVSTVPAARPYYNSGVMVWQRRRQSADLFKQWHAEWGLNRRLDQPPLCRVLNRMMHRGFKVAELPSRYNNRLNMQHNDDSGIAIYHGRLDRVQRDMERLPLVGEMLRKVAKWATNKLPKNIAQEII